MKCLDVIPSPIYTPEPAAPAGGRALRSVRVLYKIKSAKKILAGCSTNNVICVKKQRQPRKTQGCRCFFFIIFNQLWIFAGGNLLTSACAIPPITGMLYA